jgi:excisionase family DNA binding protein
MRRKKYQLHPASWLKFGQTASQHRLWFVPSLGDHDWGADMTRKGAAEVVSHEVIGRRLLNVREAAQYLGLEVDTVYKKSRLREIPCVKVGRALRFDVKALERYIEQHTIETID